MSEKHPSVKKEEGFPLGIIAVVLLCLLALPVAIWWDGKKLSEPASHEAPDFSFLNLAGTPTSLSDLKGKVWLADFVLARCTTQCPLVTGAMEGFQKKWKAKGLRLVSFTLDAEGHYDELKQYARHAGADPACWSFLTGDYEKMIRLGIQGFHLPDTGNDGSDFLHSSRITLVDAQGNIRGYYDGLNSEDLKALDKVLTGLLSGKS